MIANISVFDAEKIRYRASFLPDSPDVLIGGCILTATYARGDVLVNTPNPVLYAEDNAWDKQKEAIDLVKAASAVFIKWFETSE
jgi:hypothetical protein